MCNLYSMMSNKDAIREFTRYLRVAPSAEELGAMPAIFANGYGPIVRNTPEGRELALARWGMPKPAFALKDKTHDTGVSNIRDTDSYHWQQWLDVENRCVVPATSFSEFGQTQGSKQTVWFALREDRPLFFFAGIWVPKWTSVRQVKEGETTNDLYGFLTTDANEEVGAVHPKAMPVFLRTPASVDYWLTASVEDALSLQRPLPNGTLEIVARGSPEDFPGNTFVPEPPRQGSLF